MEAIFTTEQNRTLFLYSFENRLYLRTVQNERITRPLLLCNNYQNGLSGISYNNALYYSYLSHDNSLLVRNLTEPAPLFRLDGTSTVSYSNSHLVVFADRLLLFFIEKNKDSYSLKSHALFTETQPENLSECFPCIPELHILSAGQYLYVLLATADTSRLFRYNTELHTEPFATREELLHELTPLFEQELQTIRQSLAETEQKAHHSELLLERAKAQYAELMTVAEQYRSEAMKWYGKYTDKH